MACACSKRRQTTAYAAPIQHRPKPTDDPVRVEFPDGTVEEYATRLEAHAARIIAGGGKILDPK